MMKKYLGFVAVSVWAFLFSCAEIERDNQYDMRAGDNYIPKEGSSSSVVSSSSSVEPSSSSALPSSSSGAESSSSTAPSSSSAVLSSSSALQSSSSVVPSSSSSVSCTANNNTSTHYCSEGTIKAYSSVTDNDGRSYKTVVIGTQTWMAENLNYRTSDGTSRCYPTSGNTNASDADNSNCNIYGRLYTWSAALGLDPNCNTSSCPVQAKHKGICPSGWHIPSNAEWTTLTDYAGGFNTAGPKLKTASGWNDYQGKSGNGTDEFGFSALPGGYYSNSSDSFLYVGDFGSWWSATESSAGYAYFRDMRNSAAFVFSSSYPKFYLYSVRCVQD